MKLIQKINLYPILALMGLILLSACETDTQVPDGGDSGSTNGDVGIPSGETGGMCGGIAGIQCISDGDYCAMEPGVCKRVADVAGICTPRPQFCTKDYRPVCGCDGQTYSNACVAASKGINVASEGACAEE